MEKWQETIIEGMKLISKGCKENTVWQKCCSCPFYRPCSAMDQTMEYIEDCGSEVVQSWTDIYGAP